MLQALNARLEKFPHSLYIGLHKSDFQEDGGPPSWCFKSANMFNPLRPKLRFVGYLAFVLLTLFALTLVPVTSSGQVEAQRALTPTATIRIPNLIRPQVTLIAPPLAITKSAPTFVLVNVGLLDLQSVQLAGETTRTTAALAFEDQFTASVNVQSPSSMSLGESRVITLEIIPGVLAQAAMLRADLNALNFNILDDGYPEKTVVAGTPVRWNWDIAPKEAGEQEFFLSLSLINGQGSRVHWQNVPLKMDVSIAISPTGAASATPIVTPSLIPYEITLAPTEAPSPTSTPSPTDTPQALSTFTVTPTDTFMKRVSNDVADNPGTYLGILVTLLLGLVTVYFQFIRKSKKDSEGRNRR
jgi:hypothetical protein